MCGQVERELNIHILKMIKVVSLIGCGWCDVAVTAAANWAVYIYLASIMMTLQTTFWKHLNENMD